MTLIRGTMKGAKDFTIIKRTLSSSRILIQMEGEQRVWNTNNVNAVQRKEGCHLREVHLLEQHLPYLSQRQNNMVGCHYHRHLRLHLQSRRRNPVSSILRALALNMQIGALQGTSRLCAVARWDMDHGWSALPLRQHHVTRRNSILTSDFSPLIR